MIHLIRKDKYNILINSNTGRWLGFVFDDIKDEITIYDIDKQKLKNIYKSYNKLNQLVDLYDEITREIKLKNDLLTDMNYLVLHTSDLCNMKCKYCYAEDNLFNCSANKMSSKTMIDAINKFYKGKDFFVLFHGREPLTNIENILETVKNFNNNKKIHFILQTNGMLLNEDIIKTLHQSGVKINVSFDGFDDESNQLRINNTTNNYTQKITKLLRTYNDISPILILHKNNIDKITEISKTLKKQHHIDVAYNFLWPTAENPVLDSYAVDNEKLFHELKKVFENSIENTEDGSYFSFKERDMYLLYGRVVYRHINNYMCNKSPCGAGRVCLCVNYNGDVYPCTTVNSQPENYMGNIYKDTTEDIINHDYVLKHRDINQINDCKNCPYSIFCGGGACSGLLYNYKKDINVKSIYCKYYYNMISYIIMKCIDVFGENIFINK